MKRIKIFDTTLRDGEQSPGCSMNLTEKIEMARQLEKLGVDVIEAGFAIASPMDHKSVQAIAAAVTRTPNTVQLLMCVMPRCHVNIAVSIFTAVPKLSARKNTQLKLTKQKVSSMDNAVYARLSPTFPLFVRHALHNLCTQSAKPCNAPHTTKVHAAPCHRPPMTIVSIRFT